MRQSATAGDCLTRLGEVSGSDVTTVDDLLARLVDDVIYHNDAEHAVGVRAMCQTLALLRPRIPVDVLVSLCGVPPSLVRSFAADLNGSLLADGDTLQRLLATEAHYRNGSEISILAATHTSVRGPHVPSLKLDEVDEIVVLRAGRVVDRGTHAVLLHSEGPYRQMWQAGDFTRAGWGAGVSRSI